MKTIKNGLDKVLEIFCIAIMGIMTILVSWQVFTRYFLNSPSAKTEVLSQYLFVWLVMYGSAYVFGKRDHMAIVFIKDKFKGKMKIIADIITEIIVGVFAAGVMIYGGFIAAGNQMGQTDAALQIPMGVIYSAIAFSGVCIVFYCIYNIMETLAVKSGVKEAI
ncbi:MAG TPA: TRAP transporter small permease [Bacteroidales bacterium]|nr:TRAP transporter small permease [Bacteroidales bacterium]